MTCHAFNHFSIRSAMSFLRPAVRLYAKCTIECSAQAKHHAFNFESGCPTQHSVHRHAPMRTPPDFLLPGFDVHSNSLSLKISPQCLAHRPRIARILQGRRSFFTSPRNYATVVAANPKSDEEGNKMLIDITSRAANVRMRPCRSRNPVLIITSGSKRSWRKTQIRSSLYG